MYEIRLNEEQLHDVLAAILCAEAEETEALELFHDRQELKERAAWSLTRLEKLRYYLTKCKEEADRYDFQERA